MKTMEFQIQFKKEKFPSNLECLWTMNKLECEMCPTSRGEIGCGQTNVKQRKSDHKWTSIFICNSALGRID